MTEQDFDPKIQPLSRTQILIGMAVTALVLLVIAKLWLQFGNFALLPVELTSIAVARGLGVASIIAIASWVVYRVWSGYRRSADFYLELVLKPLHWADLIWIGLLPGLSEELLFRGVMLPAFGFNITAVIVSSICFGVLHMSSTQQWPYVVWATAVGFLLGCSALYTGNLLVPIVAHTITNLFSSYFWKWEHSR
ncbi:CPBP family intramembrane glutamic endopeptidase [Chroococcidiopsis sp. TS-821]|uniref:CPBP family intramembrane glutamic endopeptidase n=1 Tax=Chroococcidiopsis sp. TS-821 TaxID=1378066 RepID=UPI000CEED62C|nr:type II CAAX endopeptidase family protein [Chroococcidiopsis sp. TS-821]PPS42377.1 abortive phage infection protein [Chroococcidiopsis sp. TS-821]